MAAVTNLAVARLLDAKADALTRRGENPYRIRAYRKAARAIEAHAEPIVQMLAAGRDLRTIPGVGEGIAAQVRGLVATGGWPADDAPAAAPSEGGKLQALESLGPKRAEELVAAGITSMEELAAAANEGRLRDLPGFGKALEARILEALAQRDAGPAAPRRIRPLLVPLATALQAALAAVPGVARVELGGSYRRRRDTVADLDLVASATAAGAKAAAKALAGRPAVERVLGSGATKTSVVLGGAPRDEARGIQVDLRCVPRKSYGAALLYFTGSREHNVALRGIAHRRGWKLNEYGLFDGNRQIAGADEAGIYETLGLPFIEPELREDRGEIEAAQAGRLPKLVARGDLRGDLHTHTNRTDGRNTLEAMAKAAQARGLSYMAVTDHTPKTSVAGGMPWRRFQEQFKDVDRLNRSYEDEGTKFRILKGAEVDILQDGRLDLPASAFDDLEIVVASLHHRAKQSPKELTARVLAAMATGHAHILGHPSGRMMPDRPPVDHAWERLVDAAKDQGWAFEADGQPWRQDAWDTLLHHCKTSGVRISIDSDAHAVGEFEYQDWALDQARRGWMEKGDVLNTRTADQLLKLLA